MPGELRAAAAGSRPSASCPTGSRCLFVTRVSSPSRVASPPAQTSPFMAPMLTADQAACDTLGAGSASGLRSSSQNDELDGRADPEARTRACRSRPCRRARTRAPSRPTSIAARATPIRTSLRARAATSISESRGPAPMPGADVEARAEPDRSRMPATISAIRTASGRVRQRVDRVDREQAVDERGRSGRRSRRCPGRSARRAPRRRRARRAR